MRRTPRSPAAQPGPQPVRIRGSFHRDSGKPVVVADSRLPAAAQSFLSAASNPLQQARSHRILVTPLTRGSETASGADVWWWIDSVDASLNAELSANPGEAILVPNETIRDTLERAVPSTIGRTWVASSDGPDAPSILRRYYPDRHDDYRLGVIGYNLKFLRPIVAGLVRIPKVTAAIDEWPKFASGPTGVTDRVLAESDVIVCEWCGPNAVYASQNLRAGQRLVVRLHRFELETDHWSRIDTDAVEQFVTVGDHYRHLVLDRTGWPEHKVTVIPNQVDDLQLNRPKFPDARFHVGLLGVSSQRKRLDLALDIAEELAHADPRFRLLIKSAHPESEKWVWDQESERNYFATVLPRLEGETLTRVVDWDAFGPDVASWLRSVGFVLSVSDDESFHLAPAEGMASGAVPVVRNWPGADNVYSPHWVYADPREMAQRIIELATDELQWEREAQRAHTEAATAFGTERSLAQWAALLAGDPYSQDSPS